MRQPFVYYQLLKYSATSTTDVLENAIEGLCAHQAAFQAISLRTQLQSLVQTCQDMMGSVPLEIQQHCLEVNSCLKGRRGSGGEDLAALLLGRALEAAGVAYSIQHFIRQHKAMLESRLYKTHGLQHLLQHHGPEVLASVASYINRFTDRYVERTLESHSRAQGLLALRRANPEAYAIYSKLENSRWRSRVRKTKSRFRTTSCCLDSDSAADCGGAGKGAHPKPYVVLPGRRSFSVDVHAGMDPLLGAMDSIALDARPPIPQRLDATPQISAT